MEASSVAFLMSRDGRRVVRVRQDKVTHAPGVHAAVHGRRHEEPGARVLEGVAARPDGLPPASGIGFGVWSL